MKDLVRTGLIWAVACLLAALAVIVFAALVLPVDQPIPIHWNSQGTADRFADRVTALMVLAAPAGILLLTNILLAIVPFISPRPENILKSSRIYLVTWAGSNLLVLGVTALMAFAMVGGAETGATPVIIPVILSSLCIFLIAIGNYLPKSSANWFVGVRTPWTLSSDYTWARTHRLAGWLFVLAGIAGLPFALMGDTPFRQILVVPLASVAAIVSIVYSYVVWRNAPDRK